MANEFYLTGYGRRFFDSQLPKLVESLGSIADSLERMSKEDSKRIIELETFIRWIGDGTLEDMHDKYVNNVDSILEADT